VAHACNPQEAEIWRITAQSQPGLIVHETLFQKKSLIKKGLVEWLKVQALSSNPSTATKKKSSVNFGANENVNFMLIECIQFEPGDQVLFTY
jgi:hypothetical protein